LPALLHEGTSHWLAAFVTPVTPALASLVRLPTRARK
jgi:hypothetical protein